MKYSRSHNRKTYPFESACKKTMYNSLIEANDAIEFLRKTKYVKELSAYKCTVCGFWHLTSK
ncbi:MAG TPA: hypothetical protein DEO60_01255 [Bacteroidales bacterium]|nr:hypothetical protein [Bacteroidales bacterium]HBZ19729.1 hypothetical protein [Bacteroidales bacterium]